MTIERTFTVGCMDTDASEKLDLLPLLLMMTQKDLLVPMLNDAVQTERVDFEATLHSQLTKLWADTALFGLDIAADPENRRAPTILNVYQPSTFGLPDSIFSKDSETHQRVINLYGYFLTRIASDIRKMYLG